MMNKKGFLMRDWLIGIILFSAIAALGYLTSYSLAIDYDQAKIIDPTFQENYDKFNDQAHLIATSFNSTTGTSGLSFINAVDGVFTASLTVINLGLSSISTFSSQLFSFGELLGIPDEISAIILACLIVAVTIVLIFVVISSASRGSPL